MQWNHRSDHASLITAPAEHSEQFYSTGNHPADSDTSSTVTHHTVAAPDMTAQKGRLSQSHNGINGPLVTEEVTKVLHDMVSVSRTRQNFADKIAAPYSLHIDSATLVPDSIRP